MTRNLKFECHINDVNCQQMPVSNVYRKLSTVLYFSNVEIDELQRNHFGTTQVVRPVRL